MKEVDINLAPNILFMPLQAAYPDTFSRYAVEYDKQYTILKRI